MTQKEKDAIINVLEELPCTGCSLYEWDELNCSGGCYACILARKLEDELEVTE